MAPHESPQLARLPGPASSPAGRRNLRLATVRRRRSQIPPNLRVSLGQRPRPRIQRRMSFAKLELQTNQSQPPHRRRQAMPICSQPMARNPRQGSQRTLQRRTNCLQTTEARATLRWAFPRQTRAQLPQRTPRQDPAPLPAVRPSCVLAPLLGKSGSRRSRTRQSFPSACTGWALSTTTRATSR